MNQPKEKPIPSQPVLSFEEFCIWQNLNYDHIKCNSDQYSCEAEIKYKGYLLGCNQPPLEGDVNKTSPPTVEHLNELYELSDEPTIQGNEFYLRGFKDRETWQTKPVEGEVKSAEEMYDEYYPHINVQRTDTLILMKAFARQFQSPKPVEGDVRNGAIEIFYNEMSKEWTFGRYAIGEIIVDALLSKYNFTPKG